MAAMALVLDHGGGNLVVGCAEDDAGPRVLANVKAKVKGRSETYLAEQVESCADVSSLLLRRPFDRGQCVAWDGQREIWDHMFRDVVQVEPGDRPLLITEPMFTLDALKQELDETLFEKYGFPSCLVTTAPALTMQYASKRFEGPIARGGCGIVVDVGFSATHIVPCFDGRVLNYATKRVDVGGRALTNYMKELISFRSIDVMDETYVIDKVKEDTCFCSLDFVKDLAAAGRRRNQGPFTLEYVLPDGVNFLRGFVRHRENGVGSAMGEDHQEKITRDQILHLNNERFVVPECLFNPTLIGINQAGIPEAIVQAVQETHPNLHGLLYGNVIVTGGTSKLPNFCARLKQELRPLVPEHMELSIATPEDPITCAWEGGRMLARSPAFDRMLVTREEYLEEGHHRIRRRYPV